MSIIESININELFVNNKYKFIVPIYQRNYAWTVTEINALLDDIICKGNSTYYLGTIVSYKREDGRYEVIDGQQRLTTLFLIYLYIENYDKNYNNSILGDEKLIKNNLDFEARKKYVKTLSDIANNIQITDNEVAKELVTGYKLINDYFEELNIGKGKIKTFFKNIKTTEIVIITVPENTDLNNYFKVMNTRGEQLEQHHIAKERFMSIVDDNDKNIIAEIWDACSNMNYHVQRNFNKNVREKLFSQDLLNFVDDIERFPENINKAWNILANKFDKKDDNDESLDNTLNNIIKRKIIAKNSYSNINEGKNNNSYSSIISFTYFLLHVNAVLSKNNNINDLYDDKKLLKNLEKHLTGKESAKKFIYYMLQFRFLFDQYIIKKDSQDFDYNNELELIKYKYYGNSGDYINTFNDIEIYTENNIEKKYTLDNLIKLQSTLRITYTSQRNMQWITELLKDIFHKKEATVTLKSITDFLEQYCINKIKDNDFYNLTYGNIDRIVFTYLDYLLYRDNQYIKENLKDWVVRYRTSVEHFYPQHPENGDIWDSEFLHSFGNLALVAVSDNSKFSNYYPEMKTKEFTHRIATSPKLILMASYVENTGKWTQDDAKDHQNKMIEILIGEINKKNQYNN